MKLAAKILFALCCVGGAGVRAQGFINLNFEQAKVDGSTVGNFGSISVSNAYPGWQVYYGSAGQSQAVYDNASEGGNLTSIWDTNSPGTTALQGKYSAALFSSMTRSSSISQTGTVPVGSASLIMDIFSSNPGTDDEFTVSLGGQELALIPLSQVNSSEYPYTIYGADISAFAGLANQQLDFTVLSGSQIGGQSSELIVDGIQFSINPVPEPGALSLSALGAILFGCRRWKQLKPKP